MSVLVDYSCTGCGGLHETWVSQPVPAERQCPLCGASSKRRFGGALLRGVPGPAPTPAPAAGPAMCQRYPTVPGLCHMTPSAARGWIARAQGDGRALDRELARQETAVAEGRAESLVPPVAHDHGPGSSHSHSHGHGHGSSHGHQHDSGASGGHHATTAVRDQ
jgi:hypothetical protein